MLTYSIKSNAQVNTFTNVQVTNTMTTNGNAVFNSSVRLSNLSGGNSLAKIMVDQNGFLLKGPEVPTSWECLPFTPNWNIGGNNAFPLISVPGSTIPYADIGTCDLVDFMLKSNNKHAQWIKPDGSVMFGTGVGSNSGGPEYRFNEGVIRLQGMNSYGGPQVIFDGGVNQFGDWGIEYLSSTVTAVPGLNFWKPSYSPNSYNYLFFIDDNGKVSVGAVTNSASARFNVDGWSGDGIKTSVDANAKAYVGFNKITNKENFCVLGDGRLYAGEKRIQSSHLHANAQYQFDGKLACKELVVVDPFKWADFVFEDDYQLPPLDVVESFYLKNKRLNNISSEKQVKEEGIDVAELFSSLLQKIEELTLYVVEQNKRLRKLEEENLQLKK